MTVSAFSDVEGWAYRIQFDRSCNGVVSFLRYDNHREAVEAGNRMVEKMRKAFKDSE